MTDKIEFVTNVWRCGPPPATGQKQRYPSRFFKCFRREYPIGDKKVLHMFAGSVRGGDTTDIRPESGAKIIAPYDSLPIPDNVYDFVIADPPYNSIFAEEWKADLPKPKLILKEAIRVTKPGGIVAILHVIIMQEYKTIPADMIAVHGIMCGGNNAGRWLSVFRKKGSGGYRRKPKLGDVFV